MKLAHLIIGTLVLAAGTVRAEDRLFLTGAEYADAAYYTYLGLVLPGPGRENGRGFLQRYWLDRFGYEYLGGPGRVEASAWGAEASLGYGAGSASGWWSVWLGVRHTDTDLTPDDPGAEARGSQTGAKVQAEFERALSSAWRFGAMGSYANQQNGYWGRMRLMYGATPVRSYGIEFVANGNDEADSTATGLVFTARPAGSRFTVSLKAGYRFQDDDYDGAYGGVEFGSSF
jgi:hypothetical protein